jgi:hypothetical protein
MGLAIELWQASITSPESEGVPQLMRYCSVQPRLGANPSGIAGRNQRALPSWGVVSGCAFFCATATRRNDEDSQGLRLFGFPKLGLRRLPVALG